MADNWLSTDEAIAEVCDQAVKEYGGTSILSIRCPSKEIQAKVRKYLDGKRGGKTIDTYVGGINDTVAGLISTGADTPSKSRAKKGDTPPISRSDEDYAEMASHDDGEGDEDPDLDQIADDKHSAQMADLTPEDDPELDGLV